MDIRLCQVVKRPVLTPPVWLACIIIIHLESAMSSGFLEKKKIFLARFWRQAAGT